MNTLNMIAFRTIKANKKRTILIGAAVILTALLFTTTFSIIISLNQSVEAIKMLAAGSDFHSMIIDISKQDAEKVRTHSLVRESFVIRNFGIIIMGKDETAYGSGNPTLLSCGDQNIMSHLFSKITEGRYPENGSEILLNKQWCGIKNIKSGVGDEITIYTLGTARNYIICGFYEQWRTIPP